MSAAAIIPVLIAVMHAQAVERVLAPFVAAGATASLAAIAWDPDGKDRSVRAELLKKGIIRPHGPGRYWYDRAAQRAAEKKEGRDALKVVGVLGALAGTAALALLAIR